MSGDRRLDSGPYRYVWIDALTQKVREGGRVVNVSAVIATAVNVEGRREIIGFDVITSETTEGWTTFLRSLVARGLSGVELIISDAHGGIKAAIGTVFAGASWQRCRTHFMANLASRTPKSAWPMIAALVRSIFEQADRDATWNQLGDVVDRLTQTGYVDQAVMVLDAADEILAFTAFPVEHWPKIRSNNPQERLNKEIRRRTDVVGIFPNRRSVIRLMGALLAEQSDEWLTTERYMAVESLKTPAPQRAIRVRSTTIDRGCCWLNNNPAATAGNSNNRIPAQPTRTGQTRTPTHQNNPKHLLDNPPIHD